ncbi:zinc transporter ZupT [Corynebacterium halotolerans]|uniref:Zinc transporter ZupT n=1 Tax=Corynebacterium halotolerans YIM 70093 = DSM 44683 TaxID=1121362 RepID=M1P619_9CORY|nr:zinc transporter ZupT [Corynebacterium halotolerans]AGF72086.1 zinc transporter ZupT [Corynebacterium halotolerans YIM 70093 = DSM 44683]
MYDVSTVLFAFGLTLFAGLATGIGGLIAVLRKDQGPRFLAGALGLSAGVMLYVSFLEILPKAFDELGTAWGERTGAWAAVGAFFAGIALIAVIDRLVPEPINPHERGISADPQLSAQRRRMMKMGVFTAGAIAIHNFPEGFATFIAGLEDASIAIPVALAIAIHNVPEGVAVAVPIRQATGSRRKALAWSTVSGLAEPAGALVGFALLMPFLGPVTLGLSFAAVAGIMVFICLDELLPTAVATGRHHTAIYGLVAGMAIMAVSLLLFI